MKNVNLVLFEHMKLTSKKITGRLIALLLLPMVIFGAMCVIDLKETFPNIPDVVMGIAIAILVIGLIALIPLGISLIKFTRKKAKDVFRDFPGCPEEYRLNAEAEFDFLKEPCKVYCSFDIAHGDAREIPEVQYNEEKKVMAFTYIGKVRVVPGSGRYPFLGTFDAYTAVLAGEQAEALAEQMRIHGIKITALSDEHAGFVVQALNERA